MRGMRIPLAAAALLIGLAFAVPAHPQPAPPGTWTLKAPRPTITNEAAAVAIGGKLYAPGGSQNGKSMDRLDEYDPATDRWRSRAPMPQPLDHLGVAVVNNKLYTFGGFIGAVHQGASDAALEYDPATDTLAAARADEGAALGGRRGRGQWQDPCHRRPPARQRSARDARGVRSRDRPMDAMRRRSRSRATTWRWWPSNGQIHAIGGRLSTPDEPTARHDIYDPGDQTRGRPGRRCRRRAAAWRRKLYRGMILVVGGETRKATFVENEGYDVKSGQWRHARAAAGRAARPRRGGDRRCRLRRRRCARAGWPRRHRPADRVHVALMAAAT